MRATISSKMLSVLKFSSTPITLVNAVLIDSNVQRYAYVESRLLKRRSDGVKISVKCQIYPLIEIVLLGYRRQKNKTK